MRLIYQDESEFAVLLKSFFDKDKIKTEYPLCNADGINQYRADIYLDIKALHLTINEKDTEIQGPIVIELKRQLQFDTASRYFKLHKQLKAFNNYQSFILIYDKENELSENIKRIEKEGFYIYNKKEFLDSLKLDETKNSTTIDLNSTNIEAKDWKVERTEILTEAKKDFTQGNISLFLGAGVSMAAGLPGWNTLLERMLSETNDYQDHLDGSDLNNISNTCGFSSIVLGRFVKVYHENHGSPNLSKERFIDIIRNALYKDFDINQKSDLLCQLTQLIKTGYISGIITYNFDNILETYLENDKIECYPIFKNNAPQQKFPIYHVHGFIPRQKEVLDTPMPVLSEEQYHEVYANAYNWGNIEQLHALNRTTCFFIGLSMNDPNLRRILEISHHEADEQARHYVFLSRQTKFKTEKKDKCYQYVQTKILNKLGLNVIWYDKHDELPKLLSQLIP